MARRPASSRLSHAASEIDAVQDATELATKVAGDVKYCLGSAWKQVTVKPGSYPWGNHENAWRPQHIHFSVFGHEFTRRLVTQMYFPGDPLFEFNPIFHSVRDPKARELLVARFDIETTQPEWALGYQWDIVLGRGGSGTTPLEES